MKRLLIIIMCCLMLAGCFFAEPPPTEAPPVETLPEPTEAPTEIQTAPPESEAPEPIPETEPETLPPTEVPTEPETEPQTFTFAVYTANNDADGFESTEVDVAAISDTIVMEQLIEAGVLTADTALNSFEASDETLYLDFNTAFQDQLFSTGTAGERMLMGSVVNTFLSAYDAERVMITVDGEILESGHVIYDFGLEFFN